MSSLSVSTYRFPRTVAARAPLGVNVTFTSAVWPGWMVIGEKSADESTENAQKSPVVEVTVESNALV